MVTLVTILSISYSLQTIPMMHAMAMTIIGCLLVLYWNINSGIKSIIAGQLMILKNSVDSGCNKIKAAWNTWNPAEAINPVTAGRNALKALFTCGLSLMLVNTLATIRMIITDGVINPIVVAIAPKIPPTV